MVYRGEPGTGASCVTCPLKNTIKTVYPTTSKTVLEEVLEQCHVNYLDGDTCFEYVNNTIVKCETIHSIQRTAKDKKTNLITIL